MDHQKENAPPYRHCFRCGIPLPYAIGPGTGIDGSPCPPHDSTNDHHTPFANAVHFHATGNYGSRVFDPAPYEGIRHIEIAICDWCLEEKPDRVRLFMVDGEVVSFAVHIEPRGYLGEKPEKGVIG